MENESQQQARCPLAWPEQRRNLLIFACCTGMQYLAAPVLYVGITQASLCRLLGADTRTSNLPATFFFAMTAMPALLAWMSPKVSVLKRNLTMCYALVAVMLAATGALLLAPTPDSVKLAAVILQGGVSGAAMPAAIALLWEAISRGSQEKRRGLALSLAFGVGPMLAVLGSLGHAALFHDIPLGEANTAIPPELYDAALSRFAILFFAASPIIAVAAVLAQFLVIPAVAVEPQRAPVGAVVGLLVGLPLMFAAVALMQIADQSGRDQYRYLGYAAGVLATAAFIWHFRAILRQRVLLLATIATILLYAGNMIPSNMNLYSPEALGGNPADYAGVQNVLRFSFKVAAGLFLGWLLMRTNPRTGMLATSVIFLSSQLWAMFVTGPWYLVAFGLFGAGELIGVYAPNYIVSASRPGDLRRNTAFMTMLMAPAAPAGYLYGALVDVVKASDWGAFGLDSATFGFRLSFFVCGCFMAAGMVVAWGWLPARPGVGDDVRARRSEGLNEED